MTDKLMEWKEKMGRNEMCIELSIQGCVFDDTHVRHLLSMKNLRKVNVVFTGITDQGVKVLMVMELNLCQVVCPS